MENLYLIKLSDKFESFYKIGLTVHKYCRFYEIMKYGYNITIVYMVLGLDFYLAIKLENHLQNVFKSHLPHKKFGGYTECFKNISIKDYKNELLKFINEKYETIENLPITWR